MTGLFDSLPLGNITLKNRILMAPLTRGRAEEDGTPTALMAEYYGQRASAGLIIAEATAMHPKGYGWYKAPGIWNDKQMLGWRKVTDAVHAKGGRIFLQLWHMGRVSHPDFLDGELPVAPSAIAAKGETRTSPSGEKKPYVTPHALTEVEIEQLIQEYANASQRAVDAGFDGVEIHAANGYLLDQFIRDGANKRTDNYGGSLENRWRLPLAATHAAIKAIGADRVGIRLSSVNPFNDMTDSDPITTFTYGAEQLNALKPVYLHVMEALPAHPFGVESPVVHPHLRKAFNGLLILNGGRDKAASEKALADGEADAMAFGTPFLANPDLPERYAQNAPLNTPDQNTFYTHDAEGYTDYPTLQQARNAA